MEKHLIISLINSSYFVRNRIEIFSSQRPRKRKIANSLISPLLSYRKVFSKPKISVEDRNNSTIF